ncbi:MAG: S8 family serine peptidase, partial [Saprospiraceae bacterium]
MTRLKVIVNKLNIRKSPVSDFAHKGNVVGVLLKDAVFESVGEITNELGKWYKDRDGFYYWGKGVEEISSVIETRNFLVEEIKSNADNIGWGLRKLSIKNFWQDAGNEGENITIAILDTGISSIHPDFDFTKITRFNILNGDKLAEDTNGHGSHVAGIIGAQGKKV